MLLVKPIRQKPNFCGVATLKMVLDYFGIKVSEKKLIRLTGATAKKGTSAEGIKKTAQKLGFLVGIKDGASFSDIKYWLNKKVPVIVSWFSVYGGYPEGHYSVVVDLDRNYIYLQDPEIAAIRKMNKKDFLRVWFDFEGDFMKSKNDLVLRRLISVYRK